MLVLFRKDGHEITFFSKQTPAIRYLAAALIPIAAGVVVTLISSLLHIEPSPDAPKHGSLLTIILWMPFGALGEELGWRGYLHKKLDTRFNGLISSLLVGLIWFPIHMSFFSRGPLFVFFLATLIISYSVVIYALVQDTGFNVLLASVFHLFINVANLLFLDIIYETPLMIVNALVWVVVAVMVILRKKELFFATKQ
jgi:membrane protease YdiL (CAAX protease family)